MVQAFFSKLKTAMGKAAYSAGGKLLGQQPNTSPYAAQAIAIVLDMAASGQLGRPGEGARSKGLQMVNQLMQNPEQVQQIMPQIRQNPGSAYQLLQGYQTVSPTGVGGGTISTGGGTMSTVSPMGTVNPASTNPQANQPAQPEYRTGYIPREEPQGISIQFPGQYETGEGTISGGEGAPTPISTPEGETNNTGTPFTLTQWKQMIMSGDVDINRVPRFIIDQLIKQGIMTEEELNTVNQNYYYGGQSPKALPQLPYSPEQVTQVISGGVHYKPGPINRAPKEVL